MNHNCVMAVQNVAVLSGQMLGIYSQIWSKLSFLPFLAKGLWPKMSTDYSEIKYYNHNVIYLVQNNTVPLYH